MRKVTLSPDHRQCSALSAIPCCLCRSIFRTLRENSFGDVVKSTLPKWSASKMRVQDDTSSIDHRTKPVTERLAKLAFDGFRNSRKGEVQRLPVESGISDFLSKTGKNGANTFSNPIAQGFGLRRADEVQSPANSLETDRHFR